MKSTNLKDFVVCQELIPGHYDCYTIRENIDCNPLRFKVIADFDTYEEADEYIDYMQHPEDYFNLDDD